MTHDDLIARLRNAAEARGYPGNEIFNLAADALAQCQNTLKTIGAFPISDPKNQDAVNMALIALAALPTPLQVKE